MFSTFHLPKGLVLLDILHSVDHKNTQSLNIPIINTNNSFCSISRNSPIVTLTTGGECEEIQEVSWSQVQGGRMRLLPEIPECTKLQLGLDTKSPVRSILDMDTPEEAKVRFQDLLDRKYMNVISQTTTDIGRANLIEVDILTEGPSITCKPYTVPLKYHEFVDHEIKWLGEAGIISQNMSDWASPILVVPKKGEHVDASNNNAPAGSKNSKFNLQLFINYRKLNSQIQIACQMKANRSLGKVISNYPLLKLTVYKQDSMDVSSFLW